MTGWWAHQGSNLGPADWELVIEWVINAHSDKWSTLSPFSRQPT
jgi:hypothetical protein